MRLRKQQFGGIWGLAYVLGTLGFGIFIGLKIQPVYLNEMKLARAVKAVAAETQPNAEGGSASIKKALQKWWGVEDIVKIHPNDVKLKTSGNGKALTYDYWNEVELFQNVFLSFHFVKEYPVGSSTY